MKPGTRVLAITVALTLVQVALAATGRGTVPLPIGLNVTILSVPAILAAILVGPVSGVVVGAAFGLLSLALATSPLFHDPVVAVLPRLLIGPVALVVYRFVRSANESLALVMAGGFGAATNTLLVLGLATVRTGPIGAPYIAPAAAWEIIRRNVPAEAAIAGMIVLVVGLLATRSAVSARRPASRTGGAATRRNRR